jgi:hypothetical protein
MGTFL